MPYERRWIPSSPQHTPHTALSPGGRYEDWSGWSSSGTIEVVTAVVWALFGLMAASLGVLAAALFTMIGRIDGFRSEVTGRTDALRSEVTGRFDTLRGEVAARFDGLRGQTDGRFDALHSEINGRFDGVHEDLRELRVAVASLDRRLTATGG